MHIFFKFFFLTAIYIKLIHCKIRKFSMLANVECLIMHNFDLQHSLSRFPHLYIVVYVYMYIYVELICNCICYTYAQVYPQSVEHFASHATHLPSTSPRHINTRPTAELMRVSVTRCPRFAPPHKKTQIASC